MTPYSHTAIWDGEFDGYLWPLVAIWSFDRLLRLVRLVYCNLHLMLSGKVLKTTAEASYDADAKLIRLEVIPGSRLLKPGPGQHYYLYQPVKWKGWENHPFTLAAWETISNVDESPKISGERSPDDSEYEGKKEMRVAAASTSEDDSSLSSVIDSPRVEASSSDASRSKLVFFIRPFGSWTKRLQADCMKSFSNKINTTILIEGPYGEQSPLQLYENVVLVAGGAGITAALPYLQEQLRRTDIPANNASQMSATRTRDITLVWTTKQSAMIKNVASRELQPLLAREDVHFQFYVTSPNETSSTITKASDEMSREAPDKLNISYGRPNLKEILHKIIDDVQDAGSVGGRIAVLACGPTSMADQVRAATHEALKSGKRGVDYIEEAFG